MHIGSVTNQRLLAATSVVRHSQGRTSGFTVPPSSALPQHAQWFIAGILAGFRYGTIEKYMISPLGCSWLYDGDVSAGHRARFDGLICDALISHVYIISEFPHGFTFVDSEIVPVPVQIWSRRDGFEIQFHEDYSRNPDVLQAIGAAVHALLESGECGSADRRADGGLTLVTGSLGSDALLVALAMRLGDALSEHHSSPGAMVSATLWPVPDLSAL